MMKMRNFFSPFVSLVTNHFDERPIKLALTVYEQKRTRIFLVTTTDKRVMQSKLYNTEFAAFSSAYRDGEQCLVIEGSKSKGEAKIVAAKTHLTFRATGCPFLPVENHKRREVTGYLTTIGKDDKVIVVPLPNDYRNQNLSTKEKLTPQPNVDKWFSFT